MAGSYSQNSAKPGPALDVFTSRECDQKGGRRRNDWLLHPQVAPLQPTEHTTGCCALSHTGGAKELVKCITKGSDHLIHLLGL